MDFLFSIFAFILLVGILVAIHEYGHFIAAKLCNVKVLRYSIGFGKILVSRRTGHDQTEYCLSAVPLGGYVQLLDERSEEVEDHEKDRAFNNQTPLKKIFILFAGPAANFIFSIIAYTLMFSSGVPGQKPIIGEVNQKSVAWESNIREGDEVIAVGEREVKTWQSALISMIGEVLKDEEISIQLIDRNGLKKVAILDVQGRTKELTSPDLLFPGLGFSPQYPELKPVVVSVVSGSPAELSGIQKNDILLSIDGEELKNIEQFSQIIMERPRQVIELIVSRNNEDYIASVSLGLREDNPSMGFIGLQTTVDQNQLQDYMAIEKYSLLQSFFMSIEETNRMISLTINMLGKMVTGQISSDNLSGPVGIAKDAGTVAKRGIIATLSFMAIISISLGILNLLPIPVLDGGQILFVCIETIIRKPLPEKIQLFFQQIGVAALLFLMVFALYNDLSRIFG